MTRSGRRGISRWEFWPFWLFYAPVYVHLLAAGVRQRRLSSFCCANPGIPFGGLLGYSKHDLAVHLPARVLPETVIVPLTATLSRVDAERREHGIGFPCILKPDRGERGFLVERIGSAAELSAYLDRAHRFAAAMERVGLDAAGERLLLQEYVDEPAEFGVMWLRDPDEPRGRITSIVQKELLAVRGDGRASLAALIASGERTRLHEHLLRKQFAKRLDEVVPAGEELRLVEVGNHVRGATFLNANSLIDEEMISRFAPLADLLPGFFVGRFDVRCRDAAALRAGAFSVVEVNGVNSEPAHIYDPANTLRSAYRDLLEHWRAVERVAAANTRRGCSSPALGDLGRAISRHGRRLRAARGLQGL